MINALRNLLRLLLIVACQFTVSACHAETWTVAAPVIVPTLPSEQNAVYQPAVIPPQNGQPWQMLYSGGWDHPGIYYATCPAGADPSLSQNWTKQGLIWGGVDFNNVTITPDGNYTLLFSYQDQIWGATSPTIHPQSATTSWNNISVLLNPGAAGADAHEVGPVLVTDGTDSYLSYVSADQNYDIWQAYLAKFNGGVFAKDPRGPVTSLQLGTGAFGITGNITKINGMFNAWQGNGPVKGNDATQLYHVQSPDLWNWTFLNNAQPVIVPTSGFEQAADGYAVEYDGVSYLFYDEVNNRLEHAQIRIASH
jgi:hypothetical protein